MDEKQDVLRAGLERGVTVKEFIDLIGEYIERYNTKLIKRSLGGMSPMDYRKSLGLAA